ncbi:AraC family transcriptional regulator [Paenibacillus sp. OV219]|uniref:helix-turn-helix transcriptional regulator n=1 Tax=Paenibacillus sp. OV219 TaxID=1884377 RepID=UPI0008CB2487|nr:AraC family transcriptional regulator [Paenibacillus sp. OV219]SEO74669.1 AraC-type DNA-binding protein [Paenibacillus sp. OV219]
MADSTLFRGQPIYIAGGSFDMAGGDSRFNLELHKHDANSEILLIEEGEGEFEIDGRSYTAGAGSMLFYHRGIWHREQSTKHPFRCTYIGFTGLQIGELERDFFLSRDRLPIIQLHDQLPVIRKLMRDTIAESDKFEPEAQMIASHYLGIIFAKLARIAHYGDEAQRSRFPAKEAVWKAKRIIEENYSAPLTLDTLAEETYLNKYHLAHLFKELVGVSPIQFLIYCRIEAAKRYLRTTSLQVKEIAEIVGYQSEPSFYNVFMKVSGVTPRKYREGTVD